METVQESLLVDLRGNDLIIYFFFKFEGVNSYIELAKDV